MLPPGLATRGACGADATHGLRPQHEPGRARLPHDRGDDEEAAHARVEQNADYILTIDAKTRKGQKNQYMFLSYLDATIAMYKSSTNKEIYKKGLSSVKGGAADYELAGVKAYEKAINSFLDDFISELGSK